MIQEKSQDYHRMFIVSKQKNCRIKLSGNMLISETLYHACHCTFFIGNKCITLVSPVTQQGHSGTFVRVGFSFLCLHAQLWPARRYVHLNLGLAKPHSGLDQVLGWIRRDSRVFALTRRVRVLDQLWYLSTSKTILTILKILLR